MSRMEQDLVDQSVSFDLILNGSATNNHADEDSFADDYENANSKYTYILELNNVDVRNSCWNRHIRKIVRDELNSKGVYVTVERQSRSSKPRNCGRSRSRARGSSYDVKDVIANTVLTRNLVEVKLKDGTELKVPFFLKASCEFIRQHLDTEGIFRKSGAIARKQKIMDELCNAKESTTLNTTTSVHDVCSALTQILRNLENPLIPYELHDLFLKCLQIEPKKQSVSCLLEAVCLLPVANIAILSYLIQFLQEVSAHSSKNLMVTNNLGVVMVQNIMPTQNDVANSNSVVSKDKIGQHCRVIEILIEYGDRVGYLTPKIQKTVQNTPISQLDAGTSDDDDERGSPSKRSRRSGSLNRLLDSVGSILKRRTKTSKIVTVVDSANSQMKTPSFVPIHTPIIKPGSTKFYTANDNNIASKSQAKKQIMEAVRRNGLNIPNSNITPMLPSKCPANFLDTSPKSSTGVETPFGPKRKILISSNLMKKRLKTSPPEIVQVQSPSSSRKTNSSALKRANSTAKMSLVQLDRSPRKLIETKPQNSGTINKVRKSPLGRSYSLRNSPCTTPSSGAGDSLSRSPSTRRTLRRGRPNTVSVGLTRPSPTNNILKLETSPPVAAATLVRSSISTSSFRKETYLYSSNTSPRRKIVMDPCSGRVSGRNSGGRPVIPESLIPKPQITKVLVESEEGRKNSKSKIEDDLIIKEQQMMTPCIVSISTAAKSKSPSKEKRLSKPAIRSMSLRDSSRSYIPRPIIASNNFTKRTPIKNDEVLQEVDEQEYSTPTPNRPQKSVSTSAITKTPLQRRNSVQELVQLFETSTLPKKNQFGNNIANHIENQANVNFRPYTRTLERKKLEPFTLQLRQIPMAKFGSAWKLNEITQKNQ